MTLHAALAIADETTSIKPGAIGAARLAVEKNVQYAGLIFQTIGGLLTRETSPKQLMGPVAIAQLSGESAQLGWIALFGLMAQISLNLGLLNLLPVPVLDGGHMVFQIQLAKKRDGVPLTRDYLQYLRKSMAEAAANLEPFEDAYARTDWSAFEHLPLFGVANRINAYNTYLLMEQAGR